uniref:Uncharacterized protein n=1 Tax=Mucochytrium quahogii TaxID=96639 RepID=A0A7S2SKW0_9STRA|mmetsp:Transcript_17445/g.28165  ORF Transcript_17445/g.28165 Transcript_17445/m.28165 type:complete len:399 (-) Transcript_17445:241-1437(-)
MVAGASLRLDDVLGDLISLENGLGAGELEAVESSRLRSESRQHEQATAMQFAPAHAELKVFSRELEMVSKASKGLAGKLVVQVLRKWEEDGSEDGNEDMAFFEELGSSLRETCMRIRPSFDMEGIHSTLAGASDSEEYARMIEDLLESLGDIYVPMNWVYGQTGQKDMRKKNKGDTTHQDSRDVERDKVQVGGKLFIGHQVKYTGMVEMLKKKLKQELLWTNTVEWFQNDEVILENTLKRFARVILNLGNRTNSGGNAYEAIMLIFGKTDKVLITPDSEQAEPVTIEVKLDSFHRVENNQGDNAEIHEEWGLVVTVGATTKYLLKNPDDVENSVGGLSAHFSQKVALSLPLPRYHNRLSNDNRHSVENQEDYLAWSSQTSFEDGHVTISFWDHVAQAP